MHVRQLKPDARALVQKVADVRELRTFPEALGTFFSYGTPQFIVVMVAASTAVRVSISPLAWSDALVAFAIVTFWVFQERFIHDKILHGEEWAGEAIHRFHHDLPYYQVSIDGLDLACAWFAVFGALAITLAPSWETALTATLFYTFMGGVYEFIHFISHTRVPLNGYLARVRRHHLKHHVISKRNWLAFTLPSLDVLLGTAPESKVDVQ